MTALDPRLLLLDPDDNVLVLGASVVAGEPLLIDGNVVIAPVAAGLGHKLARRAIARDEKVIKYGVPIGRATVPIARGDHVHVHNVRSDYTPTYSLG